MKIVERGEKAVLRPERYSGPVETETLRLAANPADADVLKVTYEAGTVTNWHSHPGGQLLYVLSKTAFIGNEEMDELELDEGTLVVVPPGERHWHGSRGGSPATFLVLTWGVTRWEETSGLERRQEC